VLRLRSTPELRNHLEDNALLPKYVLMLAERREAAS
jgi:hypothetical protein